MISKIEFRHGSKTCELENKPCVWQGTGGFGAWPVCTFLRKDCIAPGTAWPGARSASSGLEVSNEREIFR